MKAIRQVTSILTILTLSFSLNSCFIFLINGPIQKNKAIKNYTVEQESIPPNYGSKNETLLMGLEGDNSYDKYLKKNAEKYYKGKHRIISIEELSDNKYSDLDTYRYFFYFDLRYVNTNSGSLNSLSTRRFWVLDRKENKKFYASKTSSYFSKMMQGYFINLSKELSKNKTTN